jgi:hypothetical protein
MALVVAAYSDRYPHVLPSGAHRLYLSEEAIAGAGFKATKRMTLELLPQVGICLALQQKARDKSVKIDLPRGLHLMGPDLTRRAGTY